MVCAFVEVNSPHYLNLFLIMEFLMKNYITHNSAKKYPPIRKSKQAKNFSTCPLTQSTVNDANLCIHKHFNL